jgi:DNA modification methylase
VPGQLGAESTIGDWVAGLRYVLRQVARVITATGVVALNVGDSISRHRRYGAPPKGLLLAPERMALALADDGWIIRNRIVWAKPNPVPSSVTDRLNMTYELIYLLVRSPRYYFNLNPLRELHRSKSAKAAPLPIGRVTDWAGPLAAPKAGLDKLKAAGRVGHPGGKNPGDVWTIPTQPYKGAHFATFPTTLVRRLILSTCPLVVCSRCNRPQSGPVRRGVTCSCHGPARPGLVLDAFAGTATTGVVAQELDRSFIGIELNPAYVRLAEERLGLAPTSHGRPSSAESAA